MTHCKVQIMLNGKPPWRKNLNLLMPTKHGLSYHSLQDSYLSHTIGCCRGTYTLMVPFPDTKLNLWLMVSLKSKDLNILRILICVLDDILLTPNGSSHHSWLWGTSFGYINDISTWWPTKSNLHVTTSRIWVKLLTQLYLSITSIPQWTQTISYIRVSNI